MIKIARWTMCVLLFASSNHIAAATATEPSQPRGAWRIAVQEALYACSQSFGKLIHAIAGRNLTGSGDGIEATADTIDNLFQVVKAQDLRDSVDAEMQEEFLFLAKTMAVVLAGRVIAKDKEKTLLQALYKLLDAVTRCSPSSRTSCRKFFGYHSPRDKGLTVEGFYARYGYAHAYAARVPHQNEALYPLLAETFMESLCKTVLWDEAAKVPSRAWIDVIISEMSLAHAIMMRVPFDKIASLLQQHLALVEGLDLKAANLPHEHLLVRATCSQLLGWLACRVFAEDPLLEVRLMCSLYGLVYKACQTGVADAKVQCCLTFFNPFVVRADRSFGACMTPEAFEKSNVTPTAVACRYTTVNWRMH